MLNIEEYSKNVDIVDKFGDLSTHIGHELIFADEQNVLLKNGTELLDPGVDNTPPLGVVAVGVENTEAPWANKSQNDLLWTDVDTQEMYLKQKPTCYLILSKPGLGAFTVGEAISKKFDCIHLCPRNLLLDELDQKSDTGKCFEFNMRHNGVCTFDHIIKVLKQKLQSPAVQHRGYVISGFPMVLTTSDLNYLSKTLQAEESLTTAQEMLEEVILNMKKKKPKEKPIKPVGEGGMEEEIIEEQEVEEQEEEVVVEGEEVEIIVELPKFILESCCDIVHQKKSVYNTVKTILLQQFNEIMNLSMEPDILIYLTCPDLDVLAKRSNKYFNYPTNNFVIETYPTKQYNDRRWPSKYSIRDFILADKSFQSIKYHCKMPMNFRKLSTSQLCNYMEHVYCNLVDKIKEYNPKYVIQIDARLNINQITQNVFERLLFLQIPPVVIPEPLYIQEPPDDLEEFWKSVEEMNVIRSDGVNFSRSPSPWMNRCPVELKERRTIIGKPKFAVLFFKSVYLLSSLDALIKFCRNPRPYLKIKHLEPPCRIIVTGSKLTGKTMVSQCFSWIFDAPVIEYNSFLRIEQIKKYEIHARSIFPEIQGSIADARHAQWVKDEGERVQSLTLWMNNTKTVMKAYYTTFEKYVRQKEHPKEDDDPSKAITARDVSRAKQKVLDIAEFPFIDSIAECKSFVNNNEALVVFAPVELRTEKVKPDPPCVDDYDVKVAIMAYISSLDLQQQIDPTPEELINALSKIIKSFDSTAFEESNGDIVHGKWIIDGFPSNPEFWELLRTDNLLPDYTVIITENREVTDDLIEKYMNIYTISKYYPERFLHADDELLKIKKISKTPSEDIKGNMNVIVRDILQTFWDEDDLIENRKEIMVYFNELLEPTREECNALKSILDENNKLYVDVEMEERIEDEAAADVVVVEKSDIDIMNEVLRKFRQLYCLTCSINEDNQDDPKEENSGPKDFTSFNEKCFYGETNIYCPVAFKKYGILREGRTEPEFSLKFNNKIHNFCREDFLQMYQSDPTKYQSYVKPFKYIPKLRICIVGCIGSGKSTLSKLVAKELGLMYLDFSECVNDMLLPKMFKKVGRRYENSFTDPPYEVDADADDNIAAEEDENLEEKLLSNEMEFRRMIFDYFEQGAPLLPKFSQKLLKHLWFDEPFEPNGFVLDGYPRLPTDVEDMLATFCIPDIIIDLQGTSETSVSRIFPIMYQQWKAQLTEAKNKAHAIFISIKKQWSYGMTKTVVCNLIIEDIMDQVFPLTEVEHKTSNILLDVDQFGTDISDMNLLKFYHEYLELFPEPVDETEWETLDDAKERINSRIEGIYALEEENIQNLKEMLTEQNIKVISVECERSIKKVFYSTLVKLSDLRNRNKSFLEQTFVINSDLAETLLKTGFCFLSKFNRMCPVYISENPDSIQNPYKLYKKKNLVYPVIHRSYIYFICNEENVKKFRTDPLKYILRSEIEFYVEFPIGVSVLGPPKSGKSSVVANISRTFNLMPLSRGKCLRYIEENMYWTELGSKITAKINLGQTVPYELICQAVQTVILNHQTFTYGFIFDGFPETAAEAFQLSKDGLFPLIVIDLKCTKKKSLTNSQNEIHSDLLKYLPPYSSSLVKLKCAVWHEQSYQVRNWMKDNYNNSIYVDANGSLWKSFKDTVNIVTDTIPKISYYVKHLNADAVSAEVMNISKGDFQERMTGFKDICPICFHKNILRNGNYPEDKRGLIIYKNSFYWICQDHFQLVMENPKDNLSDDSVIIPEIPALVKTVNPTHVYENGACIVTYADALPSQNIVRGDSKYAATYASKTYLFCDPKCLKKFLEQPHKYHDVVVFNQMNQLSNINLQKLPNLGYLEQTLGIILTEACCKINAVRPKYPGITSSVSGLIYIALYLKNNNPKLEPTRKALYEKAFKTYEARCKLIINTGLKLRARQNPFAYYPKCCHTTKAIAEETFTDSTNNSSTSRVPVPDERYDYLCEYHKPASKVPAFLNVVDIAGLVRGAAEGQGLGNAFLSHIKACDAIFNLCRAFDDEDVIHVDGEVNPVRDLETIGEELRLKDEEQLIKDIEKLDRVVNRGNDKKLKPEYDTLLKIKSVLVDEKKHIRFGDWSVADIEVLNKYLFLTSKPALYLVNLSEKDYIRKKNKWLPKLKEWIDKNDPGAPLIPFSGVFEYKLLEMDPEERKAYLKENNVTSALDKIIVQGYKALQLEYFFTAGADEVKAWTIQKGTKAPQAAGRIHTDFEKGFIMAEVMHFKDFKEEGTEAACKAAGKYRQQGRNYVVEDGDIIFFKFNAGAGLKDAKKK